MRIITPSGSYLDLPFSPHACSGYRAAQIALEPSDLRQMRRLLRTDPALLDSCLIQLQERFLPDAEDAS